MSSPATTRDRDARRAMIWMLLSAGSPAPAVAAAMGISRARVYELAGTYRRMLERRRLGAADVVAPWAARLRAAGAIGRVA